jgi:hypothetical protein
LCSVYYESRRPLLVYVSMALSVRQQGTDASNKYV